MVSKTEFVDQLDGTAARIEAAFKAGYNAGFSDGGGRNIADAYFDLDNEWNWYTDKIKEKNA